MAGCQKTQQLVRMFCPLATDGFPDDVVYFFFSFPFHTHRNGRSGSWARPYGLIVPVFDGLTEIPFQLIARIRRVPDIFCCSMFLRMNKNVDERLNLGIWVCHASLYTYTHTRPNGPMHIMT